jgi:hypothetical protein
VFKVVGSVSWQYGGYAPGTDPNAALDLSLRMLKGRLSDFTDTLREVATQVFEPEVEAQFRSEGGRFGTPWQELSPLTVRRRKQKGLGPHPILIESGALIGSFLEADPNHFQMITPTTLQWGSSLPRSLFHQTGTRFRFRADLRQKGWGASTNFLAKLTTKLEAGGYVGSMPARPIFAMTESMTRKVKSVFTQAIYKAGQDAHFRTRGWEGISGAAGTLDAFGAGISEGY